MPSSEVNVTPGKGYNCRMVFIKNRAEYMMTFIDMSQTLIFFFKLERVVLKLFF